MFSATPAPAAAAPLATDILPAVSTHRLKDLIADGFQLLFLLKEGHTSADAATFNRRLDAFLERFETDARQFGKESGLIEESRFAFCAMVDEIVLNSSSPILEDWERNPLQLRLFGEHLAGERFFDRIERLQRDCARNLEALEIYHTCLLLGFRGKYRIEGEEKLNALIRRLGEDITRARGGVAAFSPHWRLPQRVANYVRNELPIWLYVALLALAGTALFAGYRFVLAKHAVSVLLPV